MAADVRDVPLEPPMAMTPWMGVVVDVERDCRQDVRQEVMMDMTRERGRVERSWGVMVVEE